MRFMAIVKATSEMEEGALPSEELLLQMGEFNEEMVKAGVMISGEGLLPSSKGARVQFGGEKPTVQDGPFAETKELVAGFWILECKSMEECLEWIKRTPNPAGEHSVIEVRQVAEMEDLDQNLSSEGREVHDRVRAQVEENAG